MLYRAHANLDVTPLILVGDVFRGERLRPRTIEVLEAREIISRVSTPPVGEIQGWRTRAARLKTKLGIETIEQVIEAQPGEIAALFRGISESQVIGWQEELIDILSTPRPSG